MLPLPESLESGPADLWRLDAGTLAARIATGELTAVEVVSAHIHRIEAVDPAMNAVCWRRFDEALDEARAADKRRAELGNQGAPLLGVPIAVKESIDLAGTPATFGLEPWRDRRADVDADPVRRLRDAGAIVVGKTNVSQLLIFVETDNPVYGRTDNPWDLARSPGGSSGGQAALVAAGGVPLGLGTDIGGSLRIPAAFTGTATLKPTAGRHPDLGRGSVPVGQQAIASQIGPMARTVADLILAMRALDGSEAAPRLGDPAAVDVAGLRVGVVLDDGFLAPAPAVRRAVEEAAAALAARGAQVAEWNPAPAGFDEARALFYSILGADGSRSARRLLGRSKRAPQLTDMERAGALPRWTMPLIAAALRATGRAKQAEIARNLGIRDADEYWRLVERVFDFRDRFLRAMDTTAGGPIDLLVLPPIAVPAMHHGASADLGLGGMYTALFNVLGYPAGVVPVTRVRPGEEHLGRATADRMNRAAAATEAGSAGLPVGVQVVARPWRDHVALAAMAAIEAAVRESPDFPPTPIDPPEPAA